MQLKLVITLVISVLSVFTLDAEAKKQRIRKDDDDFCRFSKLPPTNGLQILGGSCSSTVQGEIPAHNKMPSTIIIEPENGGVIKAKKDFDIKIRVQNVLTGHFSDPANGTYYTESQKLSNGLILGHLHVTVQKIVNKGVPLDASKFDFFEGVNDNGAKKGDITELDVKAKGLEPGEYRLCTLSGSDTHQPWLMPVAKRGAQDDCIRFQAKSV